MKIKYLFFTGALLTLIMGCLTLASCYAPVEPPPEKPDPACMTPKNFPNNSLGRLGIQIIEIGHVIRIIIPSDFVFDGRTADIKQSAYQGLNNLADFLRRYPYHKMTVTGYTDNLGTYRSSINLSKHQAQSLITYFWTKGVSHECLMPVGEGKNLLKTISSNRSIIGKATNRRVEIIFCE